MDTHWNNDFHRAQIQAMELKHVLSNALSESNLVNIKLYQASIRSKHDLLCKKIANLESLIKEVYNSDVDKLNQLNELYTIKSDAEMYLNKNLTATQNNDYLNDRILNSTNDEIVYARNALLQEQDLQLDTLHGTATNIKNYSSNIREEVGIHTRLLHDTIEEIDTTQTLINRNYRRFSAIVNSTSQRCLYLIIAVLSLLLLFLIFAL